MCLTLLENKAQIAEKPILVFKMLEERSGYKLRPCKTIKETPFRYMPVRFKNGRSTLESTIEVVEKYRQIQKGIHAYELLSIAQFNVKNIDSLGTWGCAVYYAVIPKGATYYLGTMCDIACDKLIVFQTKEHFEKSVYAKDYDKFAEID